MSASGVEVPDRLGPYTLIRKIGEGGMGVVHLGRDEEGREVAVKVLHPHVAADLKARDRLEREVETMRRVRSQHVAEVMGAQMAGDMPYVATRFAPGRTLEDKVLAEGPLSDREMVRLIRGLCEALVAIHAADVIHRDFKPSNVMLVDGDPLVIDFGIAHLVNATRLTQTGMFVGTPGYLAPEIIKDSEITQAADVHALASTVFFGATGKPPFGTGAFEVVCYNIMEGRAQIDLAPAWLRGWLRKALDVEPGARPSARALLKMARALDPAVTSFHETPAETRVERLSEGTRVLDTGGTSVLDAAGTSVLDPVPAGPPGRPGGSRSVDQKDDFADLLPPVQYAAPPPRRKDRSGPREQRMPQRAAAAPAVGAPPQTGAQSRVAPPPYTPAPPPYPDQRVAGYPAPRPTGPAQAYPPAPQKARPYSPPDTQPPARAVRPHTPPAADRAPYRAAHPVIGALLLAILAGAACMLPVLVSAIAVVVVLCLRVGEYLFGNLANRRTERGSSAADPLMVVVGTPWALIKAALVTLVHVPLSAMAGMCVWGILRFGFGLTTDSAAAFAAGAFVLGLFLLPGGGAPRKAVTRTLTGVIRSPGAAAVIAITLGTIAFFVVMTAVGTTPSFQPWKPPSQVLEKLSDEFRRTVSEGQMGIVDVVTGMVGDLMSSLGLGFLTRW
ncbi:serine/threonine-protein kinase [Sinosporangium siamense]|uniref:Serine/threonine protein kinase n=1 Tax=Sinosporangium siamense TaxID=1367973 RepID=A0A919RFT4_9ACTN|nr:serine/threonine-protein kinase [Sinosporangium siamense]GII92592.1 serine/threonine protein kinase [Sinosporangium siamense]